MKVKDILNLFDKETEVSLVDKKNEPLYGSRKIYLIMRDYPDDYVVQLLLNKEVIGLGTYCNDNIKITIETAEIKDLEKEDLNAWIVLGNNRYKCSLCGFELKDKAFWYCPHCGTKMEGGILRCK